MIITFWNGLLIYFRANNKIVKLVDKPQHKRAKPSQEFDSKSSLSTRFHCFMFSVLSHFSVSSNLILRVDTMQVLSQCTQEKKPPTFLVRCSLERREKRVIILLLALLTPDKWKTACPQVPLIKRVKLLKEKIVT